MNTKSKFENQKSKMGFTVMELIVSISILVIIILSVGVIFKNASDSVSQSQSLMDQMASAGAAQSLIAHDLSGLDRDGFLVIRSRMHNTAMGDLSWHFDQVTFISRQDYPNRSGANTNSPFTDSSVAPAAIVWWGQGIMESVSPPDASYLNTTAIGQGSIPGTWQQWQATLPTGVVNSPGNINQTECTLLTHKALLYGGPLSGSSTINPAGNPIMAYGGAEINVGAITGNEGAAAHITSSRYTAVAQTPAQVMQTILAERLGGNPSPFSGQTSALPEYEFYSYRHRALASVYDTELNSFTNGYFRTTPVVMNGVSSFKVEWTDGRVWPMDDPNTARRGQLRWYGPTNPTGVDPYNVIAPTNDPTVEQYWSSTPNVYGDHYVAVFSYNNKTRWPKALRISMHVQGDRLGGRDFVQVVNLPQ